MSKRRDSQSIEQKQKKNRQPQTEDQTGFGNKKLEGPNRPST